MEQTSQENRKEGFYSVTWKRYILPPIHPEGIKIILTVLFLICAANSLLLWGVGIHSFWIWLLGVPMMIFSFYFFRNPSRSSPEEESLVLAPADGIVCSICKMIPPETLELGPEERIRVSVFMSVFNVHVNRCPVGGRIAALKYHKGKFVNVAHKDSDDNERQEICIERTDGVRIGVVQIAGLVARRIYCPLKIDEQVIGGAVFGLIRFGSRLDVYLPPGVKPCVLLGQTAVAGETVLALLEKGKD